MQEIKVKQKENVFWMSQLLMLLNDKDINLFYVTFIVLKTMPSGKNRIFKANI